MLFDAVWNFQFLQLLVTIIIIHIKVHIFSRHSSAKVNTPRSRPARTNTPTYTKYKQSDSGTMQGLKFQMSTSMPNVRQTPISRQCILVRRSSFLKSLNSTLRCQHFTIICICRVQIL